VTIPLTARSTPPWILARRFWLFGLLLLIAVCAARAAFLIALPAARLSDLVDYLFDDGYYYMTVAANLADTARSTFDGLTLTNGYQPLWLLFLAVLARLTGTHPHTLFVATCLLIYAIAISGIAVASLWRDRTQRYLALCFTTGMAAAVLCWPVTFIEGLEPILLVPLMLLFVLTLERLSEQRLLYRLSLLLALAFLVRLDTLALYATTLIVSAYQLRRYVGFVRVALRLSAFVLPTVAAYLAINQWLFHSAVPVSGLAKAIGGPLFSNWGDATIFLGPAKQSLFLVVLLLPLEWLARRAGNPTTVFYRSFVVIFSAALLQCLYFSVAYTWYVMPWYCCLLNISSALLVARIVYLSSHVLTQPAGRPARLVAAAGVGVVGIWMALHALVLLDNSMPTVVRVALRRTLHVGNPRVSSTLSFNQMSLVTLQQFFDPGHRSLIAMGDRAGGLAFFGHDSLQVVQLEGLMLDRGYIDAMRAHRGDDYVERMFPAIETYMIDREVVPTIQTPTGLEYVVPEPVRGRVTNERVPTFCFPDSAVVYSQRYDTYLGTNTRMAFRFADRVDCSEAAYAIVDAIQRGIGLQHYSLPGEYDTRGGWASTASEARDRHIPLNRRADAMPPVINR
jgi:hypothetical protein